MSIIIFIGSLLVLIGLNIPIAFALLMSSIVLMFYLDAFSMEMLAQSLINGSNNFSLLAIPFFILAGELMNHGGISKRIVDFAMALVGHIKGGIGYTAIMASVIFAGLSGSAIADTAALGAILIPMMVSKGYDRKTSTGLIASGGIIAPMLPPSIPLIVFGVASGVSITKLFMAGIIPGIMIAVGLTITWWFISRKKDFVVEERKNIKGIFAAFMRAIWALFMPVIIIVGLRGGIFTPTEASVVAVVYALFVGVVIYRELNLKLIYYSLLNAVKMSSTIMFLVAAAMVSSLVITIANIPMTLSNLMEPLIGNQLLLMIVISLLVLVIGMIMDLTPIVLILTPILMPLITLAGIDPVYFGVIFILNCCIGMLTPPVGVVLNVAASVGKLSFEDTVKGVFPFLLVEVVVLILLILFPSLILVPLEWFT